ncbi:permease prefix domain 1-containing protein [Desulfosporosinus sp. BG]|uniref:permease prefix domain 1-containing protein n=1 Tax=Desulfosporosinus sp. BG TaxID=1633135 RepID=UPI00083A6344|nr:permease prefix domain 1-containing protein [Desulfosporosinus sp. BG]ODA40253.1 Cell division protein FtsW [Desulfosporosinus sp. BG]
MPSHENVSEYINKVCNQIRWKRVHPVIARELENHIDDQIQSYLSSGIEPDEATEKALIQMGDPMEIGSALDRTHRPKLEWSILILMAAALLIGLAIRMFVSSVNEFGQPLLPGSLLAVAIGVVCITAVYFFDFSLIGKYPKLTQVLIIFSNLVVFILSPRVKGAPEYLHYAVLLLPIAYAAFVYIQRKKGYWGIVLSLIAAFVLSSIPFAGSLMSETLLVFLSCLIMLNIAIAKDWFCSKPALGFILANLSALAGVLALLFTYIEYITRWFGIGEYYLPNLIKALLRGSKLFGQGDSALYNVSPFSDFNERYLLTYLTHKFGWIAFFAIVTVLTAFIVRGFYLNFKQTSILGLFISTAVLLTFTFQTIAYILCNLGFPFFSELTLPFIAYGKTATVVNMALIGLMLSVFRTGAFRFDNPYNSANSLREK